MQISKVREIATEALRRHYFLFMSLSEEGRPDCIGSGTYVLLNSKHYILTAAHVIEELLKIQQLNSFIRQWSGQKSGGDSAVSSEFLIAGMIFHPSRVKS